MVAPAEVKKTENIRKTDFPSFFKSMADAVQYASSPQFAKSIAKGVCIIDSCIFYDLTLHGINYDAYFKGRQVAVTETFLSETGVQHSLLASLDIEVLTSPLSLERKKMEGESFFSTVAGSQKTNNGNDFLLCLEANAIFESLKVRQEAVEVVFCTRNMKSLLKHKEYFGIAIESLQNVGTEGIELSPDDSAKEKAALRMAAHSRELLACHSKAYRGETLMDARNNANFVPIENPVESIELERSTTHKVLTHSSTDGMDKFGTILSMEQHKKSWIVEYKDATSAKAAIQNHANTFAYTHPLASRKRKAANQGSNPKPAKRNK